MKEFFVISYQRSMYGYAIDSFARVFYKGEKDYSLFPQEASIFNSKQEAINHLNSNPDNFKDLKGVFIEEVWLK